MPRWWMFTLAVAAALSGCGDDGVTSEQPGTTTTGAGATTGAATIAAVETTATEAVTTVVTTVVPTEHPVIGDAVTLPDGSVARLDSYTPNAEPIDRFNTSPAVGTTYSRITVEQCAAALGTRVHTIFWQALLDDNSTVITNIWGHDFQSLVLPAGACTAGAINFEVPNGKALRYVILLAVSPESGGGSFVGGEEAARWSVADVHEVDAALTATVPVSAAKIGEVVTAPDGSTATVTSVATGADLPDPHPPLSEILRSGDIVARLDIEECAGTAVLDVAPTVWYLTASDNYTASKLASTFPRRDVAPGECMDGSVYFAIRGGTTPAYALFGPRYFGSTVDESLGYWAL